MSKESRKANILTSALQMKCQSQSKMRSWKPFETLKILLFASVNSGHCQTPKKGPPNPITVSTNNKHWKPSCCFCFPNHRLQKAPLETIPPRWSFGPPPPAANAAAGLAAPLDPWTEAARAVFLGRRQTVVVSRFNKFFSVGFSVYF